MNNTAAAPTLSFETRTDGSVVLHVTDSEGRSSAVRYLAEKPVGLEAEGRMYFTPKGVAIKIGFLREGGRAVGVAWRATERTVSDAQLDEWARGVSVGHRNVVQTLRSLTPEQRWTAVEEGKLRMATQPGWNFSGSVSQAALDIKRGQTPCLDQWAADAAKK